MSKFKVGDKVTLKPIEPRWDDAPPFYTSEMEEHQEDGLVFTVKYISRTYIDIGHWVVKEDWIEHVLVSLDNV